MIIILGFVWNEAFLRQVQSSEIQSTGTISFKRRFHIYHEKSAGKSKIYVGFYHIIISFEIVSSVLRVVWPRSGCGRPHNEIICWE